MNKIAVQGELICSFSVVCSFSSSGYLHSTVQTLKLMFCELCRRSGLVLTSKNVSTESLGGRGASCNPQTRNGCRGLYNRVSTSWQVLEKSNIEEWQRSKVLGVRTTSFD